jgi:hypothetical protein
MSNVFRIALLLLFFSLSAVLLARGVEEENNTGQNIIQVSGRVRLVGNEPFPDLVITGSDGEWYVEPNERYKFRDLQHWMVTVEGIETVIVLRWASGTPAGERRILNDIRIIKIE